MCGIFGLVKSQESKPRPSLLKRITEELFQLSEFRGREASGLAVSIQDEIRIIKRDLPAHALMKTQDYERLVEWAFEGSDPIVLIGHSRLVTHGPAAIHENNQPLVREGMVVVHNGIIVNHNELWAKFPAARPTSGLDSEVLPALITESYRKGVSLGRAVSQAYRQIEGVASVAMLFEDRDRLLLASNNGSLYWARSWEDGAVFFASERFMLERAIERLRRHVRYEINQISAGGACWIEPADLAVQPFSLQEEKDEAEGPPPSRSLKRIQDVTSEREKEKIHPFSIPNDLGGEALLEDPSVAVESLRRCRRCILPETFPFLEFDEDGICTVCQSYVSFIPKGVEALEALVRPHRKRKGEPDCLVALSGGRDSCFMLHFLKRELGLNPVAYTYDWGMVTDLARRNISRLCGRLGVEHILVSADIRKKRRFIRQNFYAWAKRPRLGTVPLFMAGDKKLFYYGYPLQKRMHIDLLFYGINPFERTDFKVGFCGIHEKRKLERHYNLTGSHQLQLAAYYGKEFLLNPAYLNASLWDTLFGFIAYYLVPQRYHNLYEYVPWEEERIVRTLVETYNWEAASEIPTTWRIGDGTASLYNYIYYTVAGFTENDTFRSHQVREGLLNREEALREVREENRPRYNSIRWYCDTNAIDFGLAVKTINRIPKLYGPTCEETSTLSNNAFTRSK